MANGIYTSGQMNATGSVLDATLIGTQNLTLNGLKGIEMKELFLISATVLILVALILGFVSYSDKRAIVENNDFNVVCLEGVEYWYRKSGYSAILAVKYDADTGTISTCE